MCKRSLIFSLLILFILPFGFGQDHNSNKIYDYVQSIEDDFGKASKQLFSINRSAVIPTNADEYVKRAEYLTLEETFASDIKRTKPQTLALDIPIRGKIYQVQLYRKSVTTSTYSVKAASGAATQPTSSIFYRGIVKNKKESFVSMSMLNSGIHMTISNNNENFEINKIDDKLYAAYRVSDSKRTQDTGCSSGTLYQDENVKIKGESTKQSTGECIEVYIECDFRSYQDNGSSIVNTEDWALAIMNEVGILYENEGIPIVVSDILVYDFSDPYLAGSDAGEMLGIMPSVIDDYDGRLAHLFSTRPAGGGVAWVGVLCSENNGNFGPFAVSGSMNTNVTPFPIYSWNVMVVAHEMGHNIGSLHTHNCVWNGNNTQIDDCGSEGGDEQSCYDDTNPILPTNGGTIMSYCHLISGVGINFSNGFGPLPGSLLLDNYLSAGCVTGDDCFGNQTPPPVADLTYTQFNPCNPSEVQFTDLSTNLPTEYEWDMPGATPNFSTEQNPFVTYNEAGFFDVTLTVTNSGGVDDLVLMQVIEVLEAPVPDFVYEIIGENISFTSMTSTSVDSYFWDFGEGGSSTEENPIYGYQEEGPYLVELTVGSQCGPVTIEKVIDVFLPPTANFNVNETEGCAPLSVTFANTSSENADEYEWTFDGGTPETSNEENPTVSYDEAGDFAVTLKVINEIGEDAITKSSYISVNGGPTADFSSEVNGLEVSFENLSDNFDSVMWNFGDGNTSTENNPTHNYTMEDTYNVVLSVINDCNIDNMTFVINLNTMPSAGFSVDNSEGCLPLTIDFENNSSSNSKSWEWSFPGGTPSSSTEENPTVVYELAGSFDVTLIVSNEVGEDSEIKTNFITVVGFPTADFAFDTNDFAVDFTDMSSNYESISWDFGDGTISTETNPSHTYTNDGTYVVILSTTNMCGTNAESKTILISTLPVAGYSASATEGCIPFVVTYSDASSENVISRTWSFPGGTPTESTEENPTVTYNEVGEYAVSLLVTSTAGDDIIENIDYITTKDVPVASFDFSELSLFEYEFNNNSVDAVTYIWDFGDGTTSTEDGSLVHQYEEPGTYTIVLNATNECGTTKEEKEITIEASTSVNNIDILSAVSINPNPNNGDFILSMNALVSGDLEIDIYNILGQKVKKDIFKISTGQNNKSILIENQPSGAYFIMLRNGNQSNVMKFLKH